MHITFPHIPMNSHAEGENFETRCCYTFYRFMKFYHALNEHERVRLAILETAAETHMSAGYVAKILVENGLQAPKSCFPHEFVNFIESKSSLDPWAAGAMSYAQNKLAKQWHIRMHEAAQQCVSHTASNGQFASA